MNPVKRRLGVLRTLASCHRALIGSYVVEAYVPDGAIRRMLVERPMSTRLVAASCRSGRRAWRSGAWSLTPMTSSCSGLVSGRPSSVTAAQS
ncbi:DUF411 domain-containing protein [Methylobacterium sp. EM32]|uniref:DUF411 domain-containing protein n=1 Tax=Methylobacterium sp. EM32 TaxID=3163481 RepID=UPI0033B554C2